MKDAFVLWVLWMIFVQYNKISGFRMNDLTRNGICSKGECCKNFISLQGRCVECPVGKIGNHCDQNCKPTHYGRLCQERCDCDLNFFCSSVYGCVPRPEDQDCPSGKYGLTCEENCPGDKYGKNCSMTCMCDEVSYCHSEKGCRKIPVPYNTNKDEVSEAPIYGANTPMKISNDSDSEMRKSQYGSTLVLPLAISSIFIVCIIIIAIFVCKRRMKKPLLTNTINSNVRNINHEESDRFISLNESGYHVANPSFGRQDGRVSETRESTVQSAWNQSYIGNFPEQSTFTSTPLHRQPPTDRGSLKSTEYASFYSDDFDYDDM